MELTINDLLNAGTYTEWFELMQVHCPNLDEDYHMALKNILDLIQNNFAIPDNSELLSLFNSLYALNNFVENDPQPDDWALLKIVLKDTLPQLFDTPAQVTLIQIINFILEKVEAKP